MSMAVQNKYPRELRERAVRMVAESDGPGAFKRVGEMLGVHPDTVRYWVKTAPVDKGGKAALASEELEELKTLRRENAELRRANEILKAASAYFAKELDHPRPK